MTSTSTDTNYYLRTWLDSSSASELFKQQSIFAETIKNAFITGPRLKDLKVERVKKEKNVIFFDPKNLDV